MIDLGAVYQVAVDVRDADGVLTSPTAAVLTITLPDGSIVSPPVALPSAVAGELRVDYLTVQAGLHAWRMVTTDPVTAYAEMFDVRPSMPPLIISLADAKKHLNIAASITTDEDELRGWIEATTRVVEHFVGPVAHRTVTETHRVGTVPALVLRQTPALALTAVTPVLTSGSAYAVADLDLDKATGVVQRLDGGRMSGPLRVTYTAGRAVVEANISRAALIILQHLWRTQRGSMRGPVIGGGDDYSVSEPIPGLGYAVPNRALQLLEDDRLPPGVA